MSCHVLECAAWFTSSERGFDVRRQIDTFNAETGVAPQPGSREEQGN